MNLNTGMLAFAAVCAVALSACAAQQKEALDEKPEWVLGDSAAYPRSKYLLGVGEAENISEAKTRARAEISKIFRVELSSYTRDVSTYSQQEVETLVESSSSTELRREIEAHSRQVLKGVDIAKVWTDPQTHRSYALAILPRLKTSLSLRNEIEQLDRDTADQVERIRASDALFKKIQWSARAIELQQKRRGLNQQLQVLSTQGQGIAEEYSVDRLINDRAELVSRISLTTRVEGKNSEALAQALNDTLANKGFSVKELGEYTIEARLTRVDLEPTNQWSQSQGILSVSMLNSDRSTLGGYDWQFKVSSTRESLLDIRLMEKVKDIFAVELEPKIFEILRIDKE